jgi:hypothetical protein
MNLSSIHSNYELIIKSENETSTDSNSSNKINKKLEKKNYRQQRYLKCFVLIIYLQNFQIFFSI